MNGISVVIPAHDAATHLGAQASAVLGQLTDQDELVVVDNRSTDGTSAVACELAATDARLSVIEAPDRPGAAHARNVGASASARPLLVFCDADDIVADRWLEAMRAALAEHDYVSGWLEVERLNSPTVLSIKGRPAREMPMFLGTVPFGHGANFGVRRDLWATLGGMDEDPDVIPGEDVEFAIRVLATGASMGFTSDAVVHYRYRSSPGDLYRQARAYSAVVPLLVRRMEAEGMDSPPVFLDPLKWLWLVARLPWLRRADGRARWAYQAGVRMGLVAGSLRHRKLVL